MRHLVAFPVIASLVVLGGCAGSTTSPVTSAQASAFLAEVQQYASEACAFEPTAATVAEIAATAAGGASASAGVALAKQIAGQVCAAVSAKSAAHLGAARLGVAHVPHVGRVPVHGTFENGTRI